MSNFKPIKNQAYTFAVALINSTTTTALLAAPTLAAGNFQISKDGGAFANLATLPTVTPTGGVQVVITLSATEMSADNIGILINVTGAAQQYILIQTRDPAIPYFQFTMTDTTGAPQSGIASTITVQISKDNGSFALPASSTGPGVGITEIGSGDYWIPLTTADMTFTGTMTFKATSSNGTSRPTMITLTNAL